MPMPLAIAFITYPALVRLAPAGLPGNGLASRLTEGGSTPAGAALRSASVIWMTVRHRGVGTQRDPSPTWPRRDSVPAQPRAHWAGY